MEPLKSEELVTILDDYFAREDKKFIDVSRIPLICQDIRVIHQDINEIKDTFKWFGRLIIGAVITALLGLVVVSAPKDPSAGAEMKAAAAELAAKLQLNTEN